MQFFLQFYNNFAKSKMNTEYGALTHNHKIKKN
jgi:hypothetical protein